MRVMRGARKISIGLGARGSGVGVRGSRQLELRRGPRGGPLDLAQARGDVVGNRRRPRPHLQVRGRRRFPTDRKSTRLNSSHSQISYAVFCLKKKKKKMERCVVEDVQTSCFSLECTTVSGASVVVRTKLIVQEVDIHWFAEVAHIPDSLYYCP